MSLLEAYMLQRRRAQIRMWVGYAAVNLACLGMILLMMYI
jgi:hypothetical protein